MPNATLAKPGKKQSKVSTVEVHNESVETVVRPGVGYLALDRTKLKAPKKECKHDSSKYFYLASYSIETFLNNDQMRNLLYNINSA